MTYNVFGGTLSLTQSINQPGMSFYGSKDPTNSVKALKEDRS